MSMVLEKLNLRVRPFDYSDADYENYVRVSNTVWPDDTIIMAQMKEWDSKREAKYYYHRQVIEVDGQYVATAVVEEPSWSYAPGKYRFFIEILPDYRRQGIATWWYEQAYEAVMQREPKPNWLMIPAREDHPDGMRFAEHRGYKAMMKFNVSLLDLTTFDETPFLSKVEAAEKSPVQLKTLRELMASDPDYQRKFYDFDWEVSKDVPYTDEFTPPPCEVYVKRVFESMNLLPEGWVIAVDNGQYVGCSCLWKSQTREDKLYTGLTGVLRSHRRLGLATAMKVKALTFARDVYGAVEVETDNEENNPMYQINVHLGFKPKPAWITYEKHLD